jgi:hypothetical protein
VRKITYKFKIAKCSWNVVKLDNSCNVWGGKGQDFFLCLLSHEPKKVLTIECNL